MVTFRFEEVPAEPQKNSQSFEGVQVWQDHAKCKGLGKQADSIYFPERGANARQAKLVCRPCPVKQECLNYALCNNIRFGIWGGMTERERRTLRRARRSEEQAS